MASVNVNAIRAELYAILNGQLPVEEVHEHPVELDGALSAVVLETGPVTRKKEGLDPCWQTTAQMYLNVFALYSDEVSGWSLADCETALGNIEAAVADVVLANGSNGLWSRLDYAEPTLPGLVALNETKYRHMMIVLEAEVIN